MAISPDLGELKVIFDAFPDPMSCRVQVGDKNPVRTIYGPWLIGADGQPGADKVAEEMSQREEQVG